jgi:voltage-gated potassium channel Kch
MTAAALLVVLGSALAMEEVGLSMALGAFLAGILLSESAFKHQLEADIEPFRGLLLGLFFMSVGMGIDLPAVVRDLGWILAATFGLFLAKVAIGWVLFRASRTDATGALRGAILLAPAGEFAFVLLPMIAAIGLAPRPMMQSAVAVAALTMAMGPVLAGLLDWALARRAVVEPDGPETAGPETGDARGSVLVIGFGRFGQVVNQVLLAEGVDVTVIDRNVDAIRSAARFGFRIYYGDGSRLDVLRAAGAEEARVICVCVDDAGTATRILDLVRDSFPRARVVVRAHDRIHALDLMEKGADAQVRETLHSAMALGRIALEQMGVDPERAAEIEADVRRRDAVRLGLQQHEGLMGGSHLLHGAEVRPEPLLKPKSRAAGLTPETRALIERERDM